MARMKINLPDEMVHTDDCDFIPEVEQRRIGYIKNQWSY